MFTLLRKTMLTIGLVAGFALAGCSERSMNGDGWDDTGRDIERGVEDTGEQIQRGAEDAGETIQRGVEDLGD